MKRRIFALCSLVLLLSLVMSIFSTNANFAAPTGQGSLKGMIATFGEDSSLLELRSPGQSAPTSTLRTNDGQYSITAPNGTYELTVSKKGNVSRTYSVSLTGGTCNLDIKLHPLGDISGNGRVEVGDVAKIYAHCKGKISLTEDYLLCCADYHSNGSINIGDVAELYTLAKNKIPGDLGPIPSYVQRETDRVAELVLSKQTNRSLTFAALSDFHYPYDDRSDGSAYTSQSIRHAGLGVAGLRKQVSMDFVGLFGDYVAGAPNSTIAESKAALEYVNNAMYEAGLGVQQIWLQGNHDRNPYDTDDGDLTPEDMYANIFYHNTGTVVDPAHPRGGYGYKDFEQQKIRVIYWNSSEQSGVENVTDHCFTADQYRWMADVAFDFESKEVPSEWGVVMLSHMPVNWSKQLTAFVDAYISGSSTTVTAADDVPVTVDFIGKDRAEFICAVNGHTHNYRSSKVGNYQFWQIAAPQVCAGRYNEYATSWPEGGGELDADGTPIHYAKVADSSRSTSFCVIVVDRENRKIHALHYGAGIDREFDY